MPTTTFHPDADPESTSIDGSVTCNPVNSGPPATWAYTHAGSSDLLFNDAIDGAACQASSDNPDFPDTPTGWQAISRIIVLFDTSSLGASAHISSASLTVTPYSISDNRDTLLNAEPNIDVTDCTPASNTSLAGSDFNNVGSTRQASGTAISSFATNTPYEIALTSFAQINAAGVSKFAMRIDADTDNVEPDISVSGYQVGLGIYTAEDGNSSYWPTLSVTFERYWDVQPTAQTVTVSESVTVRIVDLISQNDAVTLTESVTVAVSTGAITPQISVNDSVTVAESVTPNLIVMPNVSDAVTLTESITKAIANTINVFDTATITESVTVRTTLTLNVNDAISLTESKTVNHVLTVNQSESISLTESVVVFTPFDSISAFDQITVSEFVSLQIPLYLINVHDSVTVTPVPTPDLVNRPSVRQPVFVNEFVHVMIPLTINKSESITVSESKTVQNPELFGNVYDSVTHTESITTAGQTVSVNVNEALTVTENVSRQNLTDTMSTSSAIGVTENVSVKLPNALTISVSESVAVASVASPSLTSYITVNDSVTHTESVTVGKTLFINSSESITATENLTARQHLTFSVNDSVALAESKTITVSNFTTTNVKPHENISVAEYALVIIRSEPDGAQGWNFSPDEGTLAKDSDWDFSHDEGVLAKDG